MAALWAQSGGRVGTQHSYRGASGLSSIVNGLSPLLLWGTSLWGRGAPPEPGAVPRGKF